MDFPHFKREQQTHGGSPGNGMTIKNLSRGPLATEGEATPGPDHINPYEGQVTARADPDPTDGSDPFVFDNVGSAVGTFDIPGPDADGPRF